MTEFFYPKGGWRRAASYVMHRLRRLPDAPHRIARGIFAGVFVSFTPLFGVHFLSAALVAWVIRGNILAALFATFVGNPLTFPFIATVALESGNWMLGYPHDMQLPQVMSAFSQAARQLWLNVEAIFGHGTARWDSLLRFYDRVWLPYMLGGIAPGIIAGLASYYLSLPLITAYQKRRAKKQRDRTERRMAARASRVAAAEARDWAEMQPDALDLDARQLGARSMGIRPPDDPGPPEQDPDPKRSDPGRAD